MAVERFQGDSGQSLSDEKRYYYYEPKSKTRITAEAVEKTMINSLLMWENDEKIEHCPSPEERRKLKVFLDSAGVSL